MQNIQLPPDLMDEEDVQRNRAVTPREKTPPPDDLWNAVSSVTPDPHNWALTGGQGAASSSAVTAYNQSLVQQHQQLVLHNPADNELQSLRQQMTQAQQMMIQQQNQVNQLEMALQSREQMLMQ